MLVVEDAHWADDASLDALAFVARRVEGLRALLVLTYRDDEVPVVSLLQRVLGGLRPPVAVRVALGPLSARAVTRLAGEPGAGLRVHASTGGNPFFVTELLAAEHEGLPASVSQAVLARVARLPEPTRALLDLLAVVPARVEPGLLDALCPELAGGRGRRPRSAGWSPCTGTPWRSGTSWPAGPSRRRCHGRARRRLHARVLSALRDRGADPARLVHHAERAGDNDTLVEVAPLAARAAAAAGAHREAAAHYRRALQLARPLLGRRAGRPARGVHRRGVDDVPDRRGAAGRRAGARAARGAGRPDRGGAEPALDELAVLVGGRRQEMERR